MGNRNVRSLIQDFQEQNVSSAGDRETRRQKRYCRNKPANTSKSRTRRKSNSRFTKSSRDECRRLRSLLGNELPILLAFLSSECNYPFAMNKNLHRIKRCHSEHNNQMPCDCVRPCNPYQRVNCYPCATYCRECSKMSVDFQNRKCRSVAV